MRTPGLEPFERDFASRCAEGRWGSAIDLCRRFLAEHPNNSVHPGADRVHKLHVDALLGASSFDGAFEAYDLGREDTRPITLDETDVVCASVIRNERPRLPFFVEYHRRSGVTRFFFVDNGSSDGSVDWLLDQPDVHLFRSSASFGRANFGAAWFELVLRRHALDRWVLLLDADELFFYPRCETRSLRELCSELDAGGIDAYPALLLDMYSDRPIRDTVVAPGEDLREVCGFFDREFCHHRALARGRRRPLQFWGGVRRRVFGGHRWSYCLSKVPLLKYRRECVLGGGQHVIAYPEERIATERGAVLHFKFVSTFPDYSISEVERREHAAGAGEYRAYAAALARDPELSLYDPSISVRLETSAQLVELGVMGTEEAPARTEAENRIARQVDVHVKLGEAALLKGKTEQGIAYYERILAFDPDFAPAHLRLGHLSLEREDFEGALRHLEAARCLLPDDARLREMCAALKERR
jgi:tetratricopeptide (TPR) repeat protein